MNLQVLYEKEFMLLALPALGFPVVRSWWENIGQSPKP